MLFELFDARLWTDIIDEFLTITVLQCIANFDPQNAFRMSNTLQVVDIII